MAYHGNVEETRKTNVRESAIEIKRNLHKLDSSCITSSANIIQAIFRLLNVIVEDETLEGRDC